MVRSITLEGAEAIADIAKRAHLKDLNLYMNDIGDKGVFKVCRACLPDQAPALPPGTPAPHAEIQAVHCSSVGSAHLLVASLVILGLQPPSTACTPSYRSIPPKESS